MHAMTEWYYADRQRRQIGPQPAEHLVQRYRAGEIDAATLVWREGMAAWQPLGSLRAELGLDDAGATLDFRVEPVLPAPDDAGAPASGSAAAVASGGGPRSAYAVATTDGDVVMAGLWRRFAASAIDGVVTGVASYALLIPLMLLFGVSVAALAEPQATGAGFGLLLTYYAISLGLPALYFAWMHSCPTQASLGKMAVGARVVRGNGDPVGFGRALLRHLAFILFAVLTCGVGVLVSGLMVAFTERKQAPHDMLCDTLVVDKWAFTDHPEWQERGLGTVTIVVLALYAVLIVVAIVAAIALAGLLSAMEAG
jgi:uncharacterized RDD family membrane protein YckC